MKRENCPFCGHRWVRRSDESPIHCPSCGRTYYGQDELMQRQAQIKKK